jgi:hypothetical protein
MRSCPVWSRPPNRNLKSAQPPNPTIVDLQPRAPQHDDQPIEPIAMWSVTGVAHHRNDLIDGRRGEVRRSELTARELARDPHDRQRIDGDVRRRTA